MKTVNINKIKSVLENNNPAFIEELAQKAKFITQQYFGRTISLYAPIYLSNYCSSHCTYCGFNNHHKIKRFKLTNEEMRKEMSYVSSQGIENILLLTGESYKATPLSYLKEAVLIAKQFFPSISIEVHPMDEPEYKELFDYGVDGVTVYQETYDKKRYKQVHLSGKKADYDYRIGTAKRAAKAGIRSISLGILLGLSEVAKDLYELYNHLKEMKHEFPGVDYSISFPRLRPVKGQDFYPNLVNDICFTKIICLTRICFPRVGINLSTRETRDFRDHAIELGVTRISAGSNTAVGGYKVKPAREQDPQFDISDKRTVKEIISLLKKRQFDPVLTDWRRIQP